MTDAPVHPNRRPVYWAALAGLGAVMLAAVIGVAAPPYDPVAIAPEIRLAPPSVAHWLGTDQFGRDLFSRMLAGAGVSMRVAFFSTTVATLAGVALGGVAGYFGGPLDRILSSLTEAMLALPGILLALALVAIVGASEVGVVLALGIAYTPNVARVVRGFVLSLRERPYVEMARNLGRGHVAILVGHIAPNMIGPIIVLASSYFALALLSESALSFLGLGVPPPYPSWGGILAEGQAFLADAPWLSLFPGAAITFTVLCINLIGDHLRDRFDPRDQHT